MRKSEIARRLARHSGVSRAEAADQLDRVVNQILVNLRKGHSAHLPGLGKFTPVQTRGINFEPDLGKGSTGHGSK